MKYVLVMWLVFANNGVDGNTIVTSRGAGLMFDDCVGWAVSIQNSMPIPSHVHYVCAPE